MITLLKHEVLQTRAMLGVAVGAALLLMLTGAALTATTWPVVSQLGLVLALLAGVGLVPAAQLLLAVQYWRTSYGRVGYLTQTLPVKGTTVYWAKTTWAWVVSLVLVGLVLAVGLPLADLVGRATGEEVGVAEGLRTAWDALTAVSPAWVAPATVALAVVMILLPPTQYFFAASIGSQAPLNRLGVGGPILVWVGLYVAVQVLTFASLVAVPVAIGDDGGELALVPFHLIAEMAAGTSGPSDVVPIGFVPALLLTGVVCVVWSLRSWKRTVSLV